MAEITIRKDKALSEVGLRRIAQLHVTEIPGGFLTRFGQQFLFLVYRSMVEHDASFVIGALAGDDLVGFICGSSDTSGLYRSFALSNAWKAARLMFPALLHPSAVFGVLETYFYPKRSISDLPQAAILNFAVDPAARGRGVGGRLLHELGTEFRNRGESTIRIVCGSEQAAAQRLYLRNGATRAGSLELHRGVKSLVLLWDTAFADVDSSVNKSYSFDEEPGAGGEQDWAVDEEGL